MDRFMGVCSRTAARLRSLQGRYMVHHLKLAKGLQFFPLSAQNRLRVAAFAMYWALPCRRMGGVV